MSELHSVSIEGLPYPVWIRPDTSDAKNMEQIFGHSEYDVCYQPPASGQYDSILDLGAYIGLSALYFKMRSPNAMIVCVEPNPENYAVLRKNVGPYGIECVHGAAWPIQTRLKITEIFDGPWGTRVGESADGDIQGYTVGWLLDNLGGSILLKADIEGTERRMFRENTGWVERVGVVACETHERFWAGCDAAFTSLFHEPEWNVYKVRETSMAVRR